MKMVRSAMLWMGLVLVYAVIAENVTSVTVTTTPSTTTVPPTTTPISPPTSSPASTSTSPVPTTAQAQTNNQEPSQTAAMKRYYLSDGWQCVGLDNNTVYTPGKNLTTSEPQCASNGFDCVRLHSDMDCKNYIVDFTATPFDCNVLKQLTNNTVGYFFYVEYCSDSVAGKSWGKTQTIILVVCLIAAAALAGIFFVLYKRRRNQWSSRTPTEDLNNPSDQRRRSRSGKHSFRYNEPTSAYHMAPPESQDSSFDSELNMGDLTNYRLDASKLHEIRAIATGAHGIVSLGDFNGERVAIKRILHPDRARDAVQSFIDEIKLMSRMDSPYIVRFIGVTWNRPRDVTLILEYMAYGDLRDHLNNTETEPSMLFPWNQKLLCCLDIVNGLLYLHSHGIIHRDLKSRNVLMTKDARGKLIDFGVSREAIEATMTQGIGTYRWTAPEVLRGKRYTVAADMYSFGILLSEFATHQVPFWDAHLRMSLGTQSTEPLSDFALLDRLRDGTIRPSYGSSAPEWLVDLAEQCLSYAPEERPTAENVATILAYIYEHMYPKTPSPVQDTNQHHYRNNNQKRLTQRHLPISSHRRMNMNAPLLTVATCNLNQWALDFDGNLERIISSIRIAKQRGATYRLGPELEICGYGCEDHFLEADTFYHCWESLASLLATDVTDGILCDIGMPVQHGGVSYNCRVFCLDRKIVFIRPKLYHADDGNYRETRWFTTWKISSDVKANLQSHMLPPMIQQLTGQVEVPFGIGAIATRDSVISSETCEELFTPDAPHISLALGGVEIIGNGSGSHHELRKLNHRIDLIRGATAKGGGVYLYANQQGCDGGRLYYDGCALIVVNGHIVAQGSQFSVADVEVITAVVDLDDVRSYRGACSSRSEQASTPEKRTLPRVDLNFRVCPPSAKTAFLAPSSRIDFKFHAPEEEIALGPACWMWDYLRRSRAKGFFLPLSGGADSASVACIVGVMCHLATSAANAGDIQVQKDIQYLLGKEGQPYEQLTPAELANSVLHTTYMGTQNSSIATETRAKTLAQEIGNYHLNVKIDSMVSAVVNTFSMLVGKTPRFGVHGGSPSEDLALQNIQARLRMVMAYLLAQLLPWVRSKSGFLLVLGSANVDEALRGYMTKYDCSSADLNPIGAVSKTDLKRLLVYAAKKYNYPTLATVVAAPPTAELRPMSSGENEEHSQVDEEDMGMTYEELGWFGRLRKIDRCGPLWMFRKLSHVWTQLTPTEIATKVKRFFFYYGINRHKMTTLTPSYHAENYSPDDNRFDLRPFLYNSSWSRQFKSIDNMATAMDKAKTE